MLPGFEQHLFFPTLQFFRSFYIGARRCCETFLANHLRGRNQMYVSNAETVLSPCSVFTYASHKQTVLWPTCNTKTGRCSIYVAGVVWVFRHVPNLKHTIHSLRDGSRELDKRTYEWGRRVKQHHFTLAVGFLSPTAFAAVACDFHCNVLFLSKP